jgi:hypothetical protein
MTKRLVLGIAAGAILVMAPLTAHADPVIPPACVIVDVNGQPVQAGYAPNGPSDCTPLPPAE